MNPISSSAALMPSFIVAAEGRGIIVVLIGGACLLLSDWLASLYFHNQAYYAQHGWPKLAAFLVAALIVWWLNRPPDETIEGSELHTKKRAFFTKKDTLFWIPAQYWPALLCLLAIGFYFWRS